MKGYQRTSESAKQTLQHSPELSFPVAILIVWHALTVRSSARGLWIDGMLVILLCWYGIRILGATPWMKRLGWNQPSPAFWGWSASAGLLCAFLVLRLARASGESLGIVHSVHLLLLVSTAGPILEELFFRGLLYWALHKTLRHIGVPAAIVYPLVVTLLAVIFALAHVGSDLIHLWSAIFTGVAFGVMRVISGSTACAALMHAAYNFTLCWLALFVAQ